MFQVGIFTKELKDADQEHVSMTRGGSAASVIRLQRTGTTLADSVLVGASAAEEIIKFINLLVRGCGEVDLGDRRARLIASQARHYLSARRNDLAHPDIAQVYASPVLPSDPVGRGGEDAVFETSGHHRIGTIGHHEVRRVDDKLRSVQGERPRALGIHPVETDHHSDLSEGQVEHRETQISGREEEGLSIIEMNLPVEPDQPRRTY